MTIQILQSNIRVGESLFLVRGDGAQLEVQGSDPTPPGSSFYQTIINGDGGAMPQEPALEFNADFTLTDNVGTSTRVSLQRRPLPSVGLTDVGERLQVNSLGAWDTAANGFLSFATTALRDVYPGLRTAGMLTYVSTTQCLYELAPDLTTWLFFAPSPALATQAAWAIDVATGSDNNSGAPGSPLASTEEFGRRLCPNGGICYLQQNTTLAIAAGTYGDLYLQLACAGGVLFTFTVNAAFTAVADTLTSVVNTVAGATQGRITVAAGPLTARQRIRSTSGANINAVAYGEGALNSATDTFVKTWYPQADTLNAVNIANGTTVALETLTTIINRFFIRPISHGAAGTITLRINDVDLPNGYVIPTAGGSATIVLNGCQIRGGRSVGNVRLLNCKVSGAPQFSNLGFGNNGQPVLAGCLVTGTPIVSTVQLNLNVCNSCDAVAWLVGNGVGSTGFGSSLSAGGGGGANEWSNGAGLTAITAVQGAQVGFNTTAFFGFGTPYAIGYALDAGVNVLCNGIANVQIPSTQNVVLAGQNYSYADLPIALPEGLGGFTTTTDAAAVSTTGANVYLVPAARGNIAPTNVFAANPRKGLYRVEAYLAVTTAGTLGVPLVQITWTDDSGVVQTTTLPFLTGLNVTTLGGSGGFALIETNGASQVQYSVIGVTTQGALQYSLRVNCRIESPG